MSSPLRILHVVHQYPPDHVGGTELATAELARAQVSAGHRVAVFHRACGEPGLRMAVQGEPGPLVYRAQTACGGPSERFLSGVWHPGLERAFAAVLEREQPQIVHIQHLMGLPLSIIGRLRRARIPFLVTLHDYWFVCPNAQLLTNDGQEVCAGPRWWLNCTRCAAARTQKRWMTLAAPALVPLFALRHRLLGKAIRRAACVLAPSQFVTRAATAHGVPAERLRVVPHGIDPAAVQPRVEGRADLCRFVYLGGLSWQKGVHVLIEAFNDAPSGAVLAVHGDETVFPEYSGRLRAAIRSPRIRFGGRLSRDQVWQALARTDVLVVPSLWYENSPLVIQEAFAAGVPVVASAVGALPEHVHHEVDGLLVPPGDPAALRDTVLRLAADRTLVERLRQGIRPVLTVTEHAARVETVYREILAP